jgi:hypothetical protein
VALRDVALGQDDVVALDAADRDLVLVEIERALRSALLGDDDLEHELLSMDRATTRGRLKRHH